MGNDFMNSFTTSISNLLPELSLSGLIINVWFPLRPFKAENTFILVSPPNTNDNRAAIESVPLSKSLLRNSSATGFNHGMSELVLVMEIANASACRLTTSGPHGMAFLRIGLPAVL